MKKLLKVLIGLSCVFTLVGCGNGEVEKEKPMIPNPFVEYESIEEAQKTLDYEIKMPETPEGYELVMIQVMSEVMLQLTYEKEDVSVTYRMEATENEIDGFYKEFSEIVEEEINGSVVTFKSNEENCEVATWNDGTYTYAITSIEGVTKELMSAMIQSIK